MVDFCGWSMPVMYKDTIMNSHLNVRTKAGVFDVSHMGQLRFTGKDRVAFLESLVVADLQNLANGCSTLSVLTNENGGIIDDCVVTMGEKYLYVVINAGCFDKDLVHINKHLQAFKDSGKDVSLHVMDDHALLALQGPSAMDVLGKLCEIDLAKMPFMTSIISDVNGRACRVTRCGYTGEDGFEISVPSAYAVALADVFLENGVLPAGLGARDTLRLEAGLCLYGNDLDETVSPVEAGLTWTIGKRRREEGGFVGSETILAQLAAGIKGAERRRVGLAVTGAPARENAPILDAEGNKVGVVTSGTFSPSLKKPIAMGYIKPPMHKAGTDLGVEVRGKVSPVKVVKMPFVPSNYFKPS
eukprot:JP435794.1.p1 GENE.JP435794.1~~JP435794.1.p1  ORF type:complete len:378 (-),score=120.23 JP435794.1:254-1324(-)